MARLNDGYQTLLSPSLDSDIKFWEKEVTPPGISGGEAIDTTTMHNSTWRTFAPRALKTLTEISMQAAYNPVVYDDVLPLINVNQLWTLFFPDGSTLEFWGYLKEFTPGANKEGEQPTADLKIQPTNLNNANPQVETAPNYTAP